VSHMNQMPYEPEGFLRIMTYDDWTPIDKNLRLLSFVLMLFVRHKIRSNIFAIQLQVKLSTVREIITNVTHRKKTFLLLSNFKNSFLFNKRLSQ